jgi:hypothetical protein
MLPAKINEPKTVPARTMRVRNTAEPLVSVEMISVSTISVLPILPDFPSGNDVNIPEAGNNAEKQKDVKEQMLGAKPFVKLQAYGNAHGDGHDNRDSHAGNKPQGSQQIFFIFIQLFQGIVSSPSFSGKKTFASYHNRFMTVNSIKAV